VTQLRGWAEGRCAESQRRAVLEGIVLGEGQDLSPHLRTSFRASGLYHLPSVDRLGGREAMVGKNRTLREPDARGR
jgi:hypothetical protein